MRFLPKEPEFLTMDSECISNWLEEGLTLEIGMLLFPPIYFPVCVFFLTPLREKEKTRGAEVTRSVQNSSHLRLKCK